MSGSSALLSFGLVGVLWFLLDVLVLYAVVPWVGLYWGRVLSFWAAASLTWALNRRFTFESRAADRAGTLISEYLRYLALMLGGAAINYGAYVVVLNWLHAPWAPAFGVAVGSVAGLFINFLSARYLVFGSRTP